MPECDGYKKDVKRISKYRKSGAVVVRNMRG